MTRDHMFEFGVIAKDKKSRARAGRITTAHGTIDTPAFVPVGTQATVKSLTPQDLKEIGVQILFGNTYHLHVRPGEEVVQKFGGLGKFMGWGGATMTDSGGFQVFSLGRGKTLIRTRNDAEEGSAPLVKITKDSVVFRSYLDGTLHTFSPEKSIEIQQKLGADIILVLDECSPYPSTHQYTKEAMERTHNWAVRCLEVFRGHPEFISGSRSSGDEMPKQVRHDKQRKQAIYGIIQGGVYKDLREESSKFIFGMDFDGIAIGGVSVGESKKQMRDALDWVLPFLPESKPRHLLGIGEIDDIFDIIERGIDTFDCVQPTRLARMGHIFYKSNINSQKSSVKKTKFTYDISKTQFAFDMNPLAVGCICYTCLNFSRAYIHHLFRVRELLGYRLATIHNLYFVTNLVLEIRKAIPGGSFLELKRKWLYNEE